MKGIIIYKRYKDDYMWYRMLCEDGLMENANELELVYSPYNTLACNKTAAVV